MLSANCQWLQLCRRPRHGILRQRIYQACAQRLLCAHFFRGHEHLQGAGFAEQARQALGAAPACDQAERSPTVAEDGVRRGHTIVSGQRQVQTSANAVTADDGADRGGEGGNQVH